MDRVIKRILVVLAVAFGALLCGVVAASADDAIAVKVPFAFVVNGVALPAGNYLVTRDSSHPEMVSIATADGQRTTLALSRRVASGSGSADGAKLEFTRIGSRIYLSQATLGSGTVREFPVPVGKGDAPLTAAW